MKFIDFFRPEYLNSDVWTRRSAIQKIKDPVVLRDIHRRIFLKYPGSYRDVVFDLAFLLRDKDLILQVCTEPAYWYWAKDINLEQINVVLQLDLRNESLDAIARATDSTPLRIAYLVRTKNYTGLQGDLQRIRLANSKDISVINIDFVMAYFHAIPPEFLDLELLKTMLHFTMFNRRERATVNERYARAGWQSAQIADTLCTHCSGKKTEIGRFEHGSWEIACQVCHGTGLLPAYTRYSKDLLVWDDSVWAPHYQS